MLWGCMHDHQQSPLDIPNHLSPHRFYFPVAASLIVDTPVRTGRPVIKWRIASICHHLPASFHNGLHNLRPWCASPHNYITQKKRWEFYSKCSFSMPFEISHNFEKRRRRGTWTMSTIPQPKQRSKLFYDAFRIELNVTFLCCSGSSKHKTVASFLSHK